MDEEDGRPGALAAKWGQPGALRGALRFSLSFSRTFPAHNLLIPICEQLSHFAFMGRGQGRAQTFHFIFGGSSGPQPYSRLNSASRPQPQGEQL